MKVGPGHRIRKGLPCEIWRFKLQLFTCGAHDAGLGTVGSLLNLLLLLLLLKPTSFFKAHVSPKDLKLGMEPKMVMKKVMARSDLASEAIWRPYWPPKYSAKNFESS